METAEPHANPRALLSTGPVQLGRSLTAWLSEGTVQGQPCLGSHAFQHQPGLVSCCELSVSRHEKVNSQAVTFAPLAQSPRTVQAQSALDEIPSVIDHETAEERPLLSSPVGVRDWSPVWPREPTPAPPARHSAKL